MSEPTDLSAYKKRRAKREAAIKIIADDAGPEFAAEVLACVRRLSGRGRLIVYRVPIAFGWKPDSAEGNEDPLLTKTLSVIAHLVLTGALTASFDPLAPVGQWANPARPPCVWLAPTTARP